MCAVLGNESQLVNMGWLCLKTTEKILGFEFETVQNGFRVWSFRYQEQKNNVEKSERS
jgi:hypothetical protein